MNQRKADSAAGRIISPDYPLFVIMFAILALGLLMVLDASYARASQQGITHGDPFYFFKQQARWAVLGLLALLGGMRARYWKLSRYGGAAMLVAVALLILVLVPHIGVHSHGAARWLKLGPIQVQPSEVAKLCTVLFLASFISRQRLHARALMVALVPVLVVAALIIKEPDLGTAMTLVVTALVMLAVGGARPRHLVMVAISGFLIVSIMALSRPYSRTRLLAFVSGDAGDQTYSYQVVQSVDALEAGGVHGLGPGQGDAKFFHLPACYTDFIATTLGEEFGLVGSLGLIALFFFFTLRGLQVAHRCPNTYGSLLATGLCTMVTFQALLNLSVISRSVPDTGVPLPMVSFGGSSLVLALLATGLLLSVSRWPDLRHIDEWGSSRSLPREDSDRLDVTRSYQVAAGGGLPWIVDWKN